MNVWYSLCKGKEKPLDKRREKKMKKMISIILAGIMVLTLGACAAKTSQKDLIVGGWTPADNMEVTDEVKELVQKAQDTIVGATYTPVAYLASQVVAGTNHRILCVITPVVPDAKGHYAIVTIYEDLDGNCSFEEVLDCEAEAGEDGLAGGWTAGESLSLPKDAKKALKKAVKGLVGAEYTPVAYLGKQVVSGTNYRILCLIRPVTPNAEAHYSLVTVYQDLQGNCSILETQDFAAQ